MVRQKVALPPPPLRFFSVSAYACYTFYDDVAALEHYDHCQTFSRSDPLGLPRRFAAFPPFTTQYKRN